MLPEAIAVFSGNETRRTPWLHCVEKC